MAEVHLRDSSLHEILNLLDARELVITPSARSAQALRRAFDERQRAAGLRAWEPARVLAWPQWTAALLSELVVAGAEDRLPLSRPQELALWTEVISADEEASNLALSTDSIADLAELAQSAFALAADHGVLDQIRPSATSRDERSFARWAELFRRGCTRRAYLPAALLNRALAEHAQAGALKNHPQLPGTLHLFDLANPSPSQQLLLDALTQLGITLHHHNPTAAEPQLQAWTVCPSERDELDLAARWLRDFLESAARDGRSPTAALIVPSLDTERVALEAVLRSTLAPELNAIAADLSSTPWSFSTGAPLASLPLISCVLDLARWTLGALPVASIGSLLLSPYLGLTAERDAAAVFDFEVLRSAQLLEPELTLHNLLELARSAERKLQKHTPPRTTHAALPSWVNALHDALRREPQLFDLLQHDRLRPRTYAEWMEVVRAIAHAAGWPGDRVLTATEFAATRALDAALDSIATLDAVAAISGDRTKRVSFATALHTLERQLRRTQQQPVASNALVEVLTPNELEGRAFDAVIFLHATDANWPAATRPHPLLSRTLQREAAMPGATPDFALAKARATMAALLAHTPHVLFTCAKENADGHLRPSPLLTSFHLPEHELTDLIAPAAPIAPIPLLDTIDAMELPALPDATLRGGSHLLKLQAACGFLAFAELRLGAAAPETREAGLDPRERGNLMHHVLEAFWREVQTRDALEAFSPAERTGILETLIDDELKHLSTESGWSEAYVDLVRARTLRVLEAWLEHELKRGPFTVLEIETQRELQLGPLKLNVRMDRIEALPEGGIAYVDYKTGKADAKAWDGDRPDEPQLPLYALLAEPGKLRALLYANVRAGKDAAWSGLQTEEDIFPMKRKRVADLATRTEEWRDVLTHLAEDFHAGRAHVDPKAVNINCARCAQRLLCRRDAAALRASDDNGLFDNDGDMDGDFEGGMNA
ncbi:probable DNA repair protein [Bryocella elongata]|uniref:Probable DNA repair protein n=1 Tax=Bryocella elongata TaxID=863522 RepID=A0A1H5WXV2_9BACT|nr:PD-(D/E)XK nuclease family protein [Bryocella elongata]SEG04258.1 probable DNA repair protein [Bryocella elongata]